MKIVCLFTLFFLSAVTYATTDPQLNAANAELAKVKAELAKAKAELERTNALNKTNAEIANTKAELEKIKAQTKEAKASKVEPDIKSSSSPKKEEGMVFHGFTLDSTVEKEKERFR